VTKTRAPGSSTRPTLCPVCALLAHAFLFDPRPWLQPVPRPGLATALFVRPCNVYSRAGVRLPRSASSASAPHLPDATRERTYERCRSAVGLTSGSSVQADVCTLPGLLPLLDRPGATQIAPPVAYVPSNSELCWHPDDRSFGTVICGGLSIPPRRRFAGLPLRTSAHAQGPMWALLFTVGDLHPLLLAGLPAHSETLHIKSHQLLVAATGLAHDS